MQFMIKDSPPKPNAGDVRTVRKFLLFPRVLRVGDEQGRKDFRWLERANIIQQCVRTLVPISFNWVNVWEDQYFAKN